MKVKICNASVTFKISEEELKSLLLGRSLEHKVLIGKSEFSMVIEPNPQELFEDFKEVPLMLILDRSESCLMLCTSTNEIKKLHQMGKSARGLSAKIEGLEVILQVDVRSDTRRRKVS